MASFQLPTLLSSRGNRVWPSPLPPMENWEVLVEACSVPLYDWLSEVTTLPWDAWGFASLIKRAHSNLKWLLNGWTVFVDYISLNIGRNSH